jgi:hypothetical protein
MSAAFLRLINKQRRSEADAIRARFFHSMLSRAQGPISAAQGSASHKTTYCKPAFYMLKHSSAPRRLEHGLAAMQECWDFQGLPFRTFSSALQWVLHNRLHINGLNGWIRLPVPGMACFLA